MSATKTSLIGLGSAVLGAGLVLCIAAVTAPTDSAAQPEITPSPTATYAAPAPGPDTTPEDWVVGTPATVINDDGSWTAADGTTGCTPGAPCDTPCEYEDSNGCYWDAATMGNGTGRSFWVDEDGNVTYTDEQPAKAEVKAPVKTPMPHEGYVTLNGEKWAYTDGWNTILYCEAPLKVGIDVDDNGNEWAGCM